MKKKLLLLLAAVMITMASACKEGPEAFVYDYGFRETVRPVWANEVVYNESVLLLEETVGGTASGKLMMDAEEIYSVRDYALTREWVRGVDWEYTDNRIVRLPDSDIPYFTEENLHGRDLMRRSYAPDGSIVTEPFTGPPEPPVFQTVQGDDTVLYTEKPLIFEYQIFVTYRYKTGAYTGPVQEYLGENLPLTMNKLKKKEDVKILLLGDSVAVGGCSSSNINSEPFLDNWCDLFADALAGHYGGTVTMDNSYSVGGQVSAYSLANDFSGTYNNAQWAVMQEEPDLVMIAWGMNDGTWNVTPEVFQTNIGMTMGLCKRVSTKPLEFIVVGTCMPNDNDACYVNDVNGARTVLYNLQPEYAPVLAELVSGATDAIFVDIGAMHNYSLINKKYIDTTVNNLNHPNDFIVRMYAMNLAASMIPDFGR